MPAQAAAGPVVDPAIARSPELSETTRLSDRRFVVTGDRAWALGTADGATRPPASTPVARWAAFWLPNLKLLDGMWFSINGDWIGRPPKTTGWGYVRADLPTTDGVSASRTDFVPAASPALVGLSPARRAHADHHAARRRTLRADVVLPVGRDHPPNRGQPGRLGVVRGKHLLFRDKGRRSRRFEAHDWAAAFGTPPCSLRTRTGRTSAARKTQQ